MKSFFRVFALIVASVVVLSASSATVNAVQITPEQEQRIKTNCVSIKSSLTQLATFDTLLRVNRGQLYESIATKLMDRFNARLAFNRVNGDPFTTTTSDYRAGLTTFRADYLAYKQDLSTALAIDCAKNPTEFAQAIDAARTKRTKVNDDVKALDRLITNYQTSTNELLGRYQQAEGTGR